jgi:hypothetical protein
MTFDVEIMLRGNERVFTERLTHDGQPTHWSEADVGDVLEKILRAVGRALDPAAEEGSISLRGLSWIVTPYRDGVVIAFEIHSASAVAGPFDMPGADLERLLFRAIQAGSKSGTVH